MTLQECAGYSAVIAIIATNLVLGKFSKKIPHAKNCAQNLFQTILGKKKFCENLPSPKIPVINIFQTFSTAPWAP
jgi:hypothetical protein